MAKKSLAAPRGMRDFYPEDMVARNAIFGAWRTAARQAAFSEYDACVVESLELLTRKAGEEIVDQIYAFKDKSDRDLALRPEMTPTLARMVAARQGALAFPIKWSTIAQCFRYERMTRGRKREHYQWNLDIIGEESVSAEAEVIATAVNAMLAMGLKPEHFEVRFNSRALLSELLAARGIAPEHHEATFIALDKRGKISDEEIRTLLQNEAVTEDAIVAVFDLFALATLEDVRALIGDRPSPALDQVTAFLGYLDAYGMADIARFDIGVIRGLSYYTGIVFEGFDATASLRAIFGGGRYDNLLQTVGGKPMTGVGLGFGDVVIAELLADLEIEPTDQGNPDLTIGYMSESEAIPATRLAASFREQGQSVDLGMRPEKAKKFFKRADTTHASQAIYLGPDDIAAGHARLKNLATRDESPIPLA
jgi:histidyl-tRNA synthetase